MTTPHQAKYWALALTASGQFESIGSLTRSISNACVDLNPHQVDAALLGLKSPISKGAILADEVGLGKTIEAGLVLVQKWAERKRRILLVVPATLRKQWQQELTDKLGPHWTRSGGKIQTQSKVEPKVYHSVESGRMMARRWI